MSFAFLALYTGDYIKDTQHLSMSEHGAYLKLLMHCWDQRGPAPLDERKLLGICNARSTDEIEAMRRVLAEFFVRMEDGFYNRRMQKEIERAGAISRARSDAGKKGYEAKAKHLPSNCLASAEQVPLPPPSPSPSPQPQEKTKTRASAARTPAAPDGVPADVWVDYLQIRKAKRQPATKTAIDELTREAGKAGLTMEQAVRLCCKRGWAGFEASWIERDKPLVINAADEAVRMMEEREARRAQG